jgi:hypothetical protein
MLSRHEYEQTTQRRCNHNGDSQDHYCTLDQQALDKTFLDAGEGHECVLAEAQKRQDGIESVLVRDEAVDADCVGEDELYGISDSTGTQTSDVPSSGCGDLYR